MLINEIFESIDGEARRAGELATFIRTTGCPLRCTFCDSVYSWGGDPSDRNMTIDEIVEKAKEFGHKNITFTGGEPLIQKDSDELINALAAEGFDVSIETCGAVDWSKRDWFVNDNPNVWVCADYKCFASGETEKMLPVETFATLRERDVLKFVVGSEEDLRLAKTVTDKIRSLRSECWVYLSPVFGAIEPKRIVEFMLREKFEHKVRSQLQLHKFFWPADMRGV